jgi:tRNA dimethylallyltransferase
MTRAMSTVDPFEIVSGKSRPPLALIAGPTASGKSDYAIKLAEALATQGRSAVIVNADSAQLYADLPILSAAPSPEDAARAAPALWRMGWRTGLLRRRLGRAGATGDRQGASGRASADPGGWHGALYTHLAGWHCPGARHRSRYPRSGARHARGRGPCRPDAEDPERAALLNPADTTRVARALEVVRSTGHSLAYWQAHKEGGSGMRSRSIR